MNIDKGFLETFLGQEYRIPFPVLDEETAATALDHGEIFPFTHFSIVMSKERKFAIYCAHNIDLYKRRNISRGNNHWHFDSRIGETNQVGNWLYKGGSQDFWDRGHLVTRDDVGWGEEDDLKHKEAVDADFDSFCWANIAPQHKVFHAGDWGKLERWIVERTGSRNKKLSVFTGPIFTERDREYCGFNKPLGCGVHIPAGFWKVVFYIGADDKLYSAAFQMIQDDYWRHDLREEYITMEKYRLLENFNVLEQYQVPLTTITKITGIKFKEHLYDTNPLFFRENVVTERNNLETPELYIIREASDLILNRKDYI
ncbi:DNA/RNA non-specific endonuclease [Bacillus inaquosorum]|uniref:DNA/RNA non-specific endonuclease n=1 Tax=Bacillus inaquosorum TaxID=483913 RepID=UPI000A10605D|nr:DNA/RNA non-specific endonuclease [Bacillus inaquosorum]ARV43897.1 hypothetical protein BCV50_02285 [Bacillus subtilis]QJC88926.1 DNA/RNA non-specific endonuclease [Bacillus subtilis]WNW24250.1 DNA/RNA non-specific endonuclease [Bacillus inaquosorum]